MKIFKLDTDKWKRVLIKEVANRKEAVIYFLQYLNKKNESATLTDFVNECLPEDFDSIMSEMIANKWVIKDNYSGRVEESFAPCVREGFEIPKGINLTTNSHRYSISSLGVEYLNSLGLVDDKYHRVEEKQPSIINNNYVNLVLGSKNEDVNQSKDFTNKKVINDNELPPNRRLQKISIAVAITIALIMIGLTIYFNT